MSPVVQAEGVTLRLGGRTILEHVSMTVGEGEFIAVLGPNGAGKSTLMKALLGLVALAEGTVSVLGVSPAQARGGVGYLPQRSGFDRETRVRGSDLVSLGLDGARWGPPVALTPGRASAGAPSARGWAR